MEIRGEPPARETQKDKHLAVNSPKKKLPVSPHPETGSQDPTLSDRTISLGSFLGALEAAEREVEIFEKQPNPEMISPLYTKMLKLESDLQTAMVARLNQKTGTLFISTDEEKELKHLITKAKELRYRIQTFIKPKRSNKKKSAPESTIIKSMLDNASKAFPTLEAARKHLEGSQAGLMILYPGNQKDEVHLLKKDLQGNLSESKIYYFNNKLHKTRLGKRFYSGQTSLEELQQDQRRER